MEIKQYEKTVRKPLNKATLLFLVEDRRILLAMKKRGFGEGRSNGVGGKVKDRETCEQAIIRETEEEISVTPEIFKKVATLNFYFPPKPQWHQQVIVYLCTAWRGKPKESEEMKPKWFKKNKIPFEIMWPDDPLWLPHVICGKFVNAGFIFGEGDKVLDYYIKLEEQKI